MTQRNGASSSGLAWGGDDRTVRCELCTCGDGTEQAMSDQMCCGVYCALGPRRRRGLDFAVVDGVEIIGCEYGLLAERTVFRHEPKIGKLTVPMIVVKGTVSASAGGNGNAPLLTSA